MRVLVTGFTGTLGSALVPRLLDDGHEVIGYSRCEYRQSITPRHPRLVMYLGDVRDRDRLLEASRGAELVYHLAAIKRIESAEEQPEEAIATNVVGTQNVLFAQRMHKIPRVVFVSTDKGCLPITLYGLSKGAAERLVLRNPHNVVCRYGNVIGSRGSVLQAFIDGIQKRGAISVTHAEMTRYWWTIEEAVDFVVRSSARPVGGLCIPTLKAYPVVGLGKAIASVLGKPPPRIEIVGLRGTEKLHEDLRTAEEGGALRSDDQAHWYGRREIEDKLRELLGVA